MRLVGERLVDVPVCPCGRGIHTSPNGVVHDRCARCRSRTPVGAVRVRQPHKPAPTACTRTRAAPPTRQLPAESIEEQPWPYRN
jgi:hypothetical protein